MLRKKKYNDFSISLVNLLVSQYVISIYTSFYRNIKKMMMDCSILYMSTSSYIYWYLLLLSFSFLSTNLPSSIDCKVIGAAIAHGTGNCHFYFFYLCHFLELQVPWHLDFSCFIFECVVFIIRLITYATILKQDIIRLPRLFQFLQRPLAQLISVLRAPKSKEGYAAIGGGSPLRRITDEQVRCLCFHHLAWNTWWFI